MGRPPAQSPNTVQEARDAIRQAKDIESMRAAQAALLPLLGLTLEQTAHAVGKDRYWVTRARTRFLRGEPPPTTHGGRRRSLIDEDEEVVLVKTLIVKQLGMPRPFTPSIRELLRSHLNDLRPQLVSESAVTALMNRACRKLFPGLSIEEMEARSWEIGRMWLIQDRLREVRESCCT